MKLKTIIVAGISGSGKGTQGRLIQDYLEKETDKRVEYVETGKFFREFIQEDSYASSLAKDVMKDGGLQPLFLAVWSWGGQFVKRLTGDEHIIIDGSPRILSESSLLHHALKFFKRETVYVFYLRLSDEEARTRMGFRGRADDINAEVVEERLSWFNESSLPAIKYFETQESVHYHELDGSLPVEEIQGMIQDLIKT